MKTIKHIMENFGIELTSAEKPKNKNNQIKL